MQTEVVPAGRTPPSLPVQAEGTVEPVPRARWVRQPEGLCSTRLLRPRTAGKEQQPLAFGLTRVCCPGTTWQSTPESTSVWCGCCQPCLLPGGLDFTLKPARSCLTFFCHMAKVSPLLCLSKGHVVRAAGAGFIVSVASRN